MYLADTPSIVTPTSSTRSKRASGPGWNGLPSNRTIVAPVDKPETSQFHIIQPQVVK
jgi:hypothetical protein